MIRIFDLTVRPRTPVLGEWLTPRKTPYSCSALLLGCSHKFVILPISQLSLTYGVCVLLRLIKGRTELFHHVQL
jgi:hypothetical protein